MCALSAVTQSPSNAARYLFFTYLFSVHPLYAGVSTFLPLFHEWFEVEVVNLGPFDSCKCLSIRFWFASMDNAKFNFNRC